MLNITKKLMVMFLLNSCSVFAFELGNESVVIDEVFPLFNVHQKKLFVTAGQKGINPESIAISEKYKVAIATKNLSISGLIGEILFKDIILKTNKKELDIEIKIQDISAKGIKITPRLVSSWYQAGLSTKQNKIGGQLTYELLLSDDRHVLINDKWVKSNKGGWVYDPPEIKLTDTLKTILKPNEDKRVLLKISLSNDVLPGQYTAYMEVSSNMHQNSFKLPLVINVLPVKLSDQAHNKYKILLYTGFKINDEIERPETYVNAMRLYGDSVEREKVFLTYLKDIKEHGFNGITIHDWDETYLEKSLKITSQLGFVHVVLHATTRARKMHKDQSRPALGGHVKKIYDNYNTELLYYGYDERGGNKKLDKQLKLNQKIHAVGGKSVNAVFWDDMNGSVNAIKTDNSKCFDVIAHSMGSHGQQKMFNALPYMSRNDYCSKNGTEYLTYWHPNIEIPVINRIFSGFWLWASGFDGIIPHGYYFPSHVEKVLTKSDKRKGVSYATSPYDDWAVWLPGKKPMRHHNSVYPSKNGPIGTLQWEGVLNGHMDLKYILTLEEKINDQNISEAHRNKIIALLNKIRNEVLQIRSSFMNDKESLFYLKKLETWKQEIVILLLN